MALPFNDPYGGGETLLNQGSSRITATATSPISPQGVVAQYNDAMSNAASLTRAMAGFTRTIGAAEAKERDAAQADLIARARAGENVSDLKTANQTEGGVGGILKNIFSGNRISTDSKAQLAASRIQGSLDFYKMLTEDKDIAAKYSAYLANQFNGDIQAKQAAFKAILEEATAKHKAANPNIDHRFYYGWNEAANKAQAAVSEDVIKKHAAELHSQSLAAAKNDIGASSGRINNEAIVENSSKQLFTDPNLATKYARMASQIINQENGNWSASAVSPTGATGLTQMTKVRFEEALARLRRTNPQLAASLQNNRADAKTSATLLLSELPYMEQAAKEALGGREPTTNQIYLLWNLGTRGGTKVLQALAAGKGNVSAYDLAKDDPGLKDALDAQGNLYKNKSINEALGTINSKMKGNNGYYQRSTHLLAMKPGVMLTERTGIPEGSKYSWSDIRNSGVAGGSGVIDSRLVNIADQASTKLGYKIPITSGHRTKDYNDSVGGAKQSYHTRGGALDLGVHKPEEQRQLARFLASIGVPGVRIYGPKYENGKLKSQGHVHIDLREGDHWKVDTAPGRKVIVTQAELEQLRAAGMKDGQAGGYYRTAGVNGSQPSQLQARAYDLGKKYGISVAQAKEIIATNVVNQAMTMAYAGLGTEASSLIGNFVTSYGAGLTPAETNKMLTAQRSVLMAANAAAVEKERQDKRRNIQTFTENMDALNKAPAEQRAAMIAELSKKFSSTPHGQATKESFVKMGLSPLSDGLSKENANNLQWRHGRGTAFWKEFGLDSVPSTKEDAYSAAINNPNITGRYNPTEIRKLIDDRFAFQRSPLGESKDGGDSPALRAEYAKYDALITSPIDAVIGTQSVFTNNPAVFNQTRAAWKDAAALHYKKVFKAFVDSYYNSGQKDPPDLQAIGESAYKLTLEWSKTQAEILKSAVASNKDPFVSGLISSALAEKSLTPINEIVKGIIGKAGTYSADGSVEFMSKTNRDGYLLENIEAESFNLPIGSVLKRILANNVHEFVVPIDGKPQTVYFKPSTADVAPDDMESSTVQSVVPTTPEAVKNRPIELPKDGTFEEKTKALEQGSLERSPTWEWPNVIEGIQNIGKAVEKTMTSGRERTQQVERERQERQIFSNWLSRNVQEQLKYSRMDGPARQQYYELWKQENSRK